MKVGRNKASENLKLILVNETQIMQESIEEADITRNMT